MDPLLLVPVLTVAILGVAVVLWYRKRQVQQAGVTLEKAASDLRTIESSLQSFVPAGNYVPERVRRPLLAQVSEIAERILPRIAKVMRRVRDASVRDQCEGILRLSSELRKILDGHNESYVQRMVRDHAKLLVEELKADEAQRVAIVRD